MRRAEQWECVVVNNNSTDDTAARFTAFAAAHPQFNLRMVEEHNQGLSYARNRGIRESTGVYIAIIDDDERIAPTFISAYITLFDTVPEAVAGGGPIVPVYPSGRPAWMSCFTERPIANTMYLGDRIREFPEGHIPGGGNMAIRRSAVKRYGVFDVSLGRVGTSLTGGEERATCSSVCVWPRLNISIRRVPSCITSSPRRNSPKSTFRV